MELITGMVHRGGVSTVLDTGCGTGELAAMLERRGYSVTALDLGLASIRRASHAFRDAGVPVPFVQGDLYRLPFRDGCYDTVVMSEVLEHIERPSDALAEAARVIRPGGYLIVSTPYRERLRYTLCIHCNTRTPVNAHLHSFDETVLTDLLAGAGCRAVRVRKYATKLAEYPGLPGMTWFLPAAVWNWLDLLLCAVTDRQAYIVIRAVKASHGGE